MKEKTQASAKEPSFPVSAANPVADWFIRLVKGIGVGIGFILPGLSGGVLAVIFGLYDVMLRFLADLRNRFWRHVQFFIPVGIGGLIGVFLFSKVVSVALDRHAALAVSLFIGFVAGTFPSLYRKAGREGRSKNNVRFMIILALLFGAGMIFVGERELAKLPANFGTWLLSGALIGLGVIVPGMSPSNFLLYFGLYDKMTAGISRLDFSVIIPLGIGLVACVLLLAKFVRYLFDQYYAVMYHLILGLVIGSTWAIVFTEVLPGLHAERLDPSSLGFPLSLVLCIVLFMLGTLLSWLFSKVEDRYDPERVQIDQ